MKHEFLHRMKYDTFSSASIMGSNRFIIVNGNNYRDLFFFF